MKTKFATLVTALLLVSGAVYLSKPQKHEHEHVGIRPVGPPVIVQPKPQPPAPREYSFEDAVNSIKESDLRKGVEYLASEELEGRMSGKRGNVVAAEYVKKEYESLGLPTMYHKFSIDRVNPGPKNETGDNFTQNIYAWIEGTDPKYKDEIVVVGAHMDHIGYGPAMSMTPGRREIHPGADDNASGTVALIGVARAFSMLKGQVKRTVVFQSYSAEEMGLIGSRFYCNNPTFPIGKPNIRDHVFMLNFDMVGHLAYGEFPAQFFAGNSSPAVSQYIRELNNKYSFGERITTQGTSGSDHASFYNKQVPIAFLHTGMHRKYHTPDDKADTLNYVGIEKVSRYAFELVWKVVQAEAKPAFNYGGFEPMEYTHDHGHPGVEFYIHKYYKHESR